MEAVKKDILTVNPDVSLVVDTPKSHPNPLALPRYWHKEFSLIPHGADVVSNPIVLHDVVVTGGDGLFGGF